VGLRQIAQSSVRHVYVSDGEWAFDHEGWTRDAELLAVTRAASLQRHPDVVIERLFLGPSLAESRAEHTSPLPTQLPTTLGRAQLPTSAAWMPRGIFAE